MEESLNFSIEFESSEDTLGGYRSFWGDEFNWVALVPYGWANLESNGYRLKVPASSSQSPYKEAAYWTMPIHLLGLGLGWTNIGEGLRNWRRRGYPDGYHPILDFLQRNYGESIFALEIYFTEHERRDIYTALADLSDSPEELSPEVESDELLSPDLRSGFYQSLGAKNSNAAKALIEGGLDPLHLESHVVGSIMEAPESGVDYTVLNLETDKQASLIFARYVGWGYYLSRLAEFQFAKVATDNPDFKVRISVVGIGQLGVFGYNTESGRWFMNSEEYGVPSLQWDAHLWGNPKRLGY